MWKLKNPFRKKENKPVDLTAGEKEIIRRYANKDWSVEEQALEIYRKYVPVLGSYGKNMYMNFMSEVDTPCPDLGLRAMYRKQVLEDK